MVYASNRADRADGDVAIPEATETIRRILVVEQLVVSFADKVRRSLEHQQETVERRDHLAFHVSFLHANIYFLLLLLHTHTHTHTHPFNGPFFRDYPGEPVPESNLDFTEARDSEWQWHQLDHMQVCT